MSVKRRGIWVPEGPLASRNGCQNCGQRQYPLELVHLQTPPAEVPSAVAVVAQDAPWKEPSRVEDDLAATADVVLRVECNDHKHPDSPRAGEVDLVVTHHRTGPLATVSIAGQFHYARLVDLTR